MAKSVAFIAYGTAVREARVPGSKFLVVVTGRKIALPCRVADWLGLIR